MVVFSRASPPLPDTWKVLLFHFFEVRQSNVANLDQCCQPVRGVSPMGGSFQEQVHDSPWSSSPATLAKEVTSSDGVAKYGGASTSLDLWGISRRTMLHEWEISLCCVPPWGLGMLVIPLCTLPWLVGRVLGFSFNFQLKNIWIWLN